MAFRRGIGRTLLATLAWRNRERENDGREEEELEEEGREEEGDKEEEEEGLNATSVPEYLDGIGTLFGSDEEYFDVEVKEEKDAFRVQLVDLNVRTNSENHHTTEYHLTETGKLVVRRGQPFTMKMTFTRPYNKDTDDLRLVIKTGPTPMPGRGTFVTLMLSDKDVAGEWGAKIINQKDKDIDIAVYTPYNCIVSRWSLQIDIHEKNTGNKDRIYRYPRSTEFCLLFNPWCKEDDVYLDHEERRNEYVLNDTGYIYAGNWNYISPIAWSLGQFEEHILDCAIHLLDKSSLSWLNRGNPVKVCRKLSALGNCQDDQGVLVGNWSGVYTDGKSPSAWNGSSNILEEYYKSKQPVKYGQCWVFSGILTTLCRTLGIPARSVTNYKSAHDTDGSITIDYYFTKEGKELTSMKTDSIWNFHVWNEVWMKRTDIKDKHYGGWQALDATPQEESDGNYQCGPMPVAAIKRGDLSHPYDGPFIFGEVNADKVMWIVDEETGLTEIKQIFSKGVGLDISTKAIKAKEYKYEWDAGFAYREDVTGNYKYKEGSSEERAAVLNANLSSKNRHIYEGKEDHDFELKMFEKEHSKFGEKFDIKVTAKNKGNNTRTVGGCLSVKSVYYTGVPYKKIKSLSFEDREIKASEETVFEMSVPFDKYNGKLAEHCHLQMACAFFVRDTNQIFLDEDDFRLLKPSLLLKVKQEVKVGEEFSVEITFDNPIPMELTQCVLGIEGPGIQKQMEIKQKDVKEKGTFKTTVSLTPKKKGSRKVIACFNAKELIGITGSCVVNVI